MSAFTKRKFQSLPESQQQKKAAEAARKLYMGNPSSYLEMRKWLGMGPLEAGLEALSNAYHLHLGKTERGLKEHNLLPRMRQGDRQEKGAPLDVSLYLDGIRSAHNVGSILRSAEAFHVKRLYFSPNTPPPTHPQVQKTSMGAWEWIEWEVAEELPGPLIALETYEGAEKIEEVVWPKGCVLAIGNEEFGCSQRVLEAAEKVVEIGLRGKKNSLNVANACAIVLFQISTCLDGLPGE